MGKNAHRVGLATWAMAGALLGACGSDAASPHDPDAGSPGKMEGDAGSTMDAGHDASGPRGADLSLPLVTPPVKAATPPALGGNAPHAQAVLRGLTDVWSQEMALDSVDIKQRFFTAGPTSVFQILGMLDARVLEINQRIAAGVPSCLEDEPVAYTISPFGQGLTFFAQCVESYAPGASEPSFLQLGRKDGVTYLYIASGAQHVAARLTPIPTADAGVAEPRYQADVWIGVGYDNLTRCGGGTMGGFECGSYGVIELHTDEARLSIELTVAGTGFGYCGAQLKSDGSRVYTKGSIDMGETCISPSELCVEASDVITPATCDAAQTTFITPPLGRKSFVGTKQSFGASLYPGGAENLIVLSGTSADSLRFGPSAPSPGVATFSSTPAQP